MFADLLLSQLGIRPGEPLPPDVQQLVDDQVERLADRIAAKVAEQLREDPAE
jgi:hypothetical protein